jgi:predicted dehydrogenase
VIADMGAHYFDFAQWARGSYTDLPIEFEGTAAWPASGFSEVPFSVDVTAGYADGVKLLMTNGSKGVRFDGDEGWLHVTDAGEITGEPKSILSQSVPRVHWAVMSGHVRDFLDCIKSRRQTRSHPEVAHRVHTICHCANISLRLRRKVVWDPRAEQFINDGQANRMIRRAPRPPWDV